MYALVYILIFEKFCLHAAEAKNRQVQDNIIKSLEIKLSTDLLTTAVLAILKTAHLLGVSKSLGLLRRLR